MNFLNHRHEVFLFTQNVYFIGMNLIMSVQVSVGERFLVERGGLILARWNLISGH